MCNNSNNRSTATSNTSSSNSHHNKLFKSNNNHHNNPNNSNSNRYMPYRILWEVVGCLLLEHRRLWEERCSTTSKLCNSNPNNNNTSWLHNSPNNRNNKLSNNRKGYHTGEIRGNKFRYRRHLNTNNSKCNSNGSSNSSASIIRPRRRATSNIDRPSRARSSTVPHRNNNSNNRADRSISNKVERSINRSNNNSNNSSLGGTRSFSANRPNMLWPRPFGPRYALRRVRLLRI